MPDLKLLPCPFCGHEIYGLQDALHPTCTGWSYGPGKRRYYFNRQHAQYKERDGDVWELGCLEHEGGCGATMHGDSETDVVNRWNRRGLPPNARNQRAVQPNAGNKPAAGFIASRLNC